ncbi:Uncharacterised protein [uncultured archaeon]|nr:Uncharacterised protein [uncultured archaeon]
MKGNYVSVRRIAGMIARSYKHLAIDIYDLVEWCGEAINNIAAFDSFRRYTPTTDTDDCKLEIVNKQALLPCNVYRLLGVYHRNLPMAKHEFVRNGAYLRFTRKDNDPFWDSGHINIEYIGIAVDEEGFPMIDEISIQACYWYCLKMLSLEDFTNGKLSPAAFGYFDEQYGKYVAKARSSFKNVTRNEMDEIAMVLNNMIPKMRLPRRIT